MGSTATATIAAPSSLPSLDANSPPGPQFRLRTTSTSSSAPAWRPTLNVSCAVASTEESPRTVFIPCPSFWEGSFVDLRAWGKYADAVALERQWGFDRHERPLVEIGYVDADRTGRG